MQGFRISEGVEIVKMQHLHSFKAMIIAIGSIILDRRLPWDVPAGSHVFQRETADTTYLREQHRRASCEADRFQEMANQY